MSKLIPTYIEQGLRIEHLERELAEVKEQLRLCNIDQFITSAELAEATVKNSLTVQRPWVGLTGPEVDEAYKSVSDKEWAIGGLADARVFFCAIEAKLREKNK
jgi:hypothetical protein